MSEVLSNFEGGVVDQTFFIGKFISWGGGLQDQMCVLDSRNIDESNKEELKEGAKIFFRHPDGGYSLVQVIHVFDSSMTERFKAAR